MRSGLPRGQRLADGQCGTSIGEPDLDHDPSPLRHQEVAKNVGVDGRTTRSKSSSALDRGVPTSASR
jgi:hypothetical protein